MASGAVTHAEAEVMAEGDAGIGAHLFQLLAFHHRAQTSCLAPALYPLTLSKRGHCSSEMRV